MAKYRKKPTVIDATQWFTNGDHPDDQCTRARDDDGVLCISEGKVVRRYRDPQNSGTNQCKHCGERLHIHGWIDTLEGGHIVCPGDFIITGVKGERYPCKPDIFQELHELVE